MIRYSLNCDAQHSFEAWFKSSDDFDIQARRGLVSCPACGSARVTKALMAPGVRKSAEKARPARKGGRPQAPASEIAVGPSAASQAPGDHAGPGGAVMTAGGAVMAKLPREVVELLRKVRDEVTRTADNVGPRFAEEARKIHYEEAPARGIYGEASLAEVKELIEEGIECHPLPVLPEDSN